MNDESNNGALYYQDSVNSVSNLDLFDLAPISMAVINSDMVCVRCNQAMAKSYGRPAEDVCEKSLRELIPDFADETEPVYRHVLESGEPVSNFRLERVLPSGRRRSWLQNIVPLPQAADGKRMLMVSVLETTESDAAQQALRETETRLHIYQQLSLDGFTILHAVRDDSGNVVDFMWEFANPAAERMANVGPMVGHTMRERMPDSAREPSLLPRYIDKLSKGVSDATEFYYEGANTKGWFRNQITPLDPDRLAVSWRDVTQRKETEEELKMVSGEYRHRIKNLLTIVSSLISHAARTSEDSVGLAETIQRQIQALAAAQDLIGHAPKTPVDLGELVTRTLRPFDETALVIEGGPPIALPQRHAIPIVLTLHELSTNALKHGGLSARGHMVTIAWNRDGDRITIRWVEQLEPGSHPVTNGRSREGFGSRLFAMVERSLPNGRMALDWRPEGLLATIGFDADGDSG